jgi:hypothetical protein
MRQLSWHRPGSFEWHDSARKGLRKNRNSAACPPILASHHSPADFSGQLSGLTRLDRVNAYFQNIKILLNLRQMDRHD